MPLNVAVLIGLALVWSAAEGFLLLRDRNRGRGSTQRDERTRRANVLATECAVFSGLFIALPSLNVEWGGPYVLTAIGTVIALLGLVLRYAAIHILGQSFRTTIEIDKDQPVVQTGPYRYIRHPSYSGIVLFFVGYGLVSQNLVCLIASFVLPITALAHRITVEEAALVDELGPRYEEYRARTKKLIPFVW